MSFHRVTITQLYGAQTCQNVLHFENFDGLMTPQAIANDVLTNWVQKVRSQQSSQLLHATILVQSVSNPNQAPFNLTTNLFGQSFGETRVPTFVAIVFKFLTARAGRHGRGRCFIPGVVTDHLDQYKLSAAGVTNWTNNVVNPIKLAYVPPNNTSPLNLCVREEAGANDLFNTLIDIQVRPVLGVQRRRNIGIGI